MKTTKTVKTKTYVSTLIIILLFLSILFSLNFTPIIKASSGYEPTIYFSENFNYSYWQNGTGYWVSFGNYVNLTANKELNVTIEDNEVGCALTFPEARYGDVIKSFVLEMDIYLENTDTSRSLFAITYINSTKQNLELWNVYYDVVTDTLYIRYTMPDGQLNAVNVPEGYDVLTRGQWHHIALSYDMNYNWSIFCIDQHLIHNNPYVLPENKISHIEGLYLGEWTGDVGRNGTNLYDNILIKSLLPQDTFQASNNKILVWWFGIQDGWSNIYPPCHIGLINKTAYPSVEGYYDWGENYTDEMNLHYGNGCRYFIVEAERDTNMTDVEIMNNFKTAHSDITLFFWFTFNATYDNHPLVNMTGVDYLILSWYSNAWADYNPYGGYPPLISMRLFGLANKTIMGLGVNDDHPSYYAHNHHLEEFEFVTTYLPEMKGLALFTWDYIPLNLRQQILEWLLKNFWVKNYKQQGVWYVEPSPLTGYQNGSSIGFNNNVTCLFNTKNEMSSYYIYANISCVNASDITVYGYMHNGYVANILINGTRYTGEITQNKGYFYFTFSAGTYQTIMIELNIDVFEPSLPILFILGMVGLFSMFLGPTYTVHKVKHKEYREAAINGFLVTLIGIVLFIAWLSA